MKKRVLLAIALVASVASVAPAFACPRDQPAKPRVVAMPASAPAGDTISGINGI